MTLKIGLPKGSLQESTFELFKRSGFDFRVSARSYEPEIDDKEITPRLIRPQEIPRYVQMGVIDCGISGKDWIEDNAVDVVELCDLTYSKVTRNPVRVVLAVHHDDPIKCVKDLEGKRIATEYVRLTERYLESHGVHADVEFSWGACEMKVPTLVDAIVVNTETGSSLRAHHLEIIDTLIVSTPRLVMNKKAYEDPWKREKAENLAMLLQASLNAENLVGLKMNVPVDAIQEVLGILPALKNPTISPLSDKSWVAVETILDQKVARDMIPALKRAGATGLVEYTLRKVIE